MYRVDVGGGYVVSRIGGARMKTGLKIETHCGGWRDVRSVMIQKGGVPPSGRSLTYL